MKFQMTLCTTARTFGVLSIILALCVPSNTAAGPLGTLLREAIERAGRSGADDVAQSTARRAGTRSSIKLTPAQEAARTEAQLDEMIEALFPTTIRLKRASLMQADPKLLLTDPQLARSLGMEAVLRKNPELLSDVLPTPKALDQMIPEEIIDHYRSVAAKEAAKPKPWANLDVKTLTLEIVRPMIVGGVELKNVKLNLAATTIYASGVCVAVTPCREAVVKLGADALLEAAAQAED